MKRNTRLTKIGLASGGLVAGVVLATTIGAQAATSTPSPGTSSGSTASATAVDPHPGDNGADGVPESQEVHGGGRGGGLDLSGTVTAVGSGSVTIKTATATTVYTVTASSDIDKNGEASLSALAVGDKVTFSVESSAGATIDKLHAGDEAKNMPTRSTGSSTSGETPSSGA
ncbi:hypothetical protein acdb102_16820 [Acidothermaceae bacterium B102]|nr:hypothetical protein acdb102_16820 [Acidothermaceae bacterium B102]